MFNPSFGVIFLAIGLPLFFTGASLAAGLLITAFGLSCLADFIYGYFPKTIFNQYILKLGANIGIYAGSAVGFALGSLVFTTLGAPLIALFGALIGAVAGPLLSAIISHTLNYFKLTDPFGVEGAKVGGEYWGLVRHGCRCVNWRRITYSFWPTARRISRRRCFG